MVLLCAVLLFYYCYCVKIIVEAIAKIIVKTIVILVTEKMSITIATNVMNVVINVKNVLAKKNLRLWSEKISGHLIKIRWQGKIAGNRIKTIQKSILL